MSLAAVKKPTLASAPSGTTTRVLKRGELLFVEGEHSRAMYYIKNGLIRIFKKKGNASIEIDTIHSGQILGELAFLDGQQRSASGEALTECQLVEISGDAFTQTLAQMPEWLKILLKTVVGRLRTASNRIRQLESASTSYVLEKNGQRTAQYTFLPPHEVLKTLSAILLVASRGGEKSPGGIQIRVGALQKFANQIMGVPIAKITTLLDVMTQVNAITIDPEKGMTEILVTDLDFIEKSLNFLNEQNLIETTKRADLTLKAFVIMSMMAKHFNRFPKDDAAGTVTVNLAEVKKLETGPSGKEPFRMDDFPELIKHGYATNLEVRSGDSVFTTVKADTFIQSYRLQRLTKAIEAINEQKG